MFDAPQCMSYSRSPIAEVAVPCAALLAAEADAGRGLKDILEAAGASVRGELPKGRVTVEARNWLVSLSAPRPSNEYYRRETYQSMILCYSRLCLFQGLDVSASWEWAQRLVVDQQMSNESINIFPQITASSFIFVCTLVLLRHSVHRS